MTHLSLSERLKLLCGWKLCGSVTVEHTNAVRAEAVCTVAVSLTLEPPSWAWWDTSRTVQAVPFPVLRIVGARLGSQEPLVERWLDA